MKILFCDIDGVVNCRTTTQRHRGAIGIDPYMAFLVGKIQLDTGCEVVLSSSWRHWAEGIKEIERQMVELYDVTPVTRLHNGTRGDEIVQWLREHDDVDRYAILDDDSDFYEWQPLFRTKWDTGLTEEIAVQVTEHLGRIT